MHIVYSTLLIDNSLDIRWRGRYNEDTDLCLQALSLGYCTVNFNAFLIVKNAHNDHERRQYRPLL